MIRVTYKGEDIFLLNDSLHWTKGYSTDFDSFTDYQQSLTARETRRPFSQTLITTVKASSLISSASLRSLQSALRELKAQPVVMPFWPAVSFWSSRAAMNITGGLLVAFKSDWSQYTIYDSTDAEPVWPLANDLIVPLLKGFADNKDLKFFNVDSSTLLIDFTESSSARHALSFSAAAFPLGIKPAGYDFAPTILPFKPTYVGIDEQLSVLIKRNQIGFRREQGATFYPHEVFRQQSANYIISGAANIASLLAWFAKVGGQGQPFYAASATAMAYLAQDAGAGAASIKTVDTNILAGDYICTFLPDGTMISAHVQNAYAAAEWLQGSGGDDLLGAGGDAIGHDANTLVLDSPFNVQLKTGQPIYILCLARLDKGKLSIKWRSPTLITATLKWSEVLPERDVPQTETIGGSLGMLKTRVVLFDFWRDYGNGMLQHWYFTSFEQDINHDGILYKSAAISVGDITTSLNLEEDSCQIDSLLTKIDGTINSGNPLTQDIILSTEAPLNVKICFADIDIEGMEGAGGDSLVGAGGDFVEGAGD